MATRFYTAQSLTPDVSPAYDGGWDETASALRRKLLISRPGLATSDNQDYLTVDANAYYLLYQFVSEPLDSISATLPVSKAVFRCYESNAKCNGFLHLVFRKCDGDGSNPVTIASMTDDVEFDSGLTYSRFIGASDLANQALSQGDRLVVEVGFYSSAGKDYPSDYGRIYVYNHTSLTGSIFCTDNSGSDLPENDTDTSWYNSWIETGDTFTVASGDPPAEVVKLGPMFAFA